MNTQAERLTSCRDAHVFGFAFLTKLAAWIELKRDARRARRHEMELREMLRTMSPELLKDIGVAFDANGDPAFELASQNAHVIATKILDQPRRHHDPY
jgi:hypothetical protein